MASTFTIPLTTLPVGTTSVPATGGAPVPDGDSTLTISINRTVANGFNSQPSSTQATVTLYQSDDGGTTWQELAAMGPVTGGSVISPKTGQLITASNLFTEFNPGTGRLVRAGITVTGASVAVAGTITTA